MKKRIWPWFAIGALALLVVARYTVFGLYRIPSGSMIPTLGNGDHVAINMLKRRPVRGDVIVFRYPNDPDKDFAKRVIGVGGDTVEIRHGAVWLNGAPLPYRPKNEKCGYDDVDDETGDRTSYRCHAFEETLGGRSYTVIHTHEENRSFPAVTVPRGQYFVMGDNRDNSHDSRYWGSVPADLVRGTLMWVWYSSSR